MEFRNALLVGLALITPTLHAQSGRTEADWERWWQFECESTLRLRLPPVAVQDGVRARIRRALHQTLESTTDAELIAACLTALAHLAGDAADPAFDAAVTAHLSHANQHVRESAILAMGYAARPAAIEPLSAILLARSSGHEFAGQRRPTERSRAFAAYALGILAGSAPDPDAWIRIVHTLRTALLEDRVASVNVQVAAVLALGVEGTRHGSTEWDLARDTLATVWRDPLTPVVVRAHVPTALERLIGTGNADSQRDPLHAELCSVVGRPRGVDPRVVESSMLALARITAPTDPEFPFVRDALIRVLRSDGPPDVREIACIALARLGGPLVHRVLVAELERGGPMRDWAAIALGMSVRGALPTDATLVARGLTDSIRGTQSIERASIAIGLGLTGAPAAAAALREMVDGRALSDPFEGIACLALGLVGDARDIPRLQELATPSPRKWLRTSRVLLGLQLLGHDLSETMTDPAFATESGIAVTGDLRSPASGPRVDQLLKLLTDGSQTELRRAFAAVALGFVGRRGGHRGAALSAGINFRAAPATLTDGQNGVLDYWW